MQAPALSPLPDQFPRRPRIAFQPGDLVAPVQGYPTLCEIVCTETDSRIRVRGLDWPRGYTVILSMDEVQPISNQIAA